MDEYRREIRTLCLLSEHPNSVTFYGYLSMILEKSQGDVFVMVMDLVKSPDNAWRALFESHWSTKVRFCIKVARVLVILHGLGFVHCNEYKYARSNLISGSDTEQYSH